MSDVDQKELIPGKVYSVAFDDCCIHGSFTDEFVGWQQGNNPDNPILAICDKSDDFPILHFKHIIIDGWAMHITQKLMAEMNTYEIEHALKPVNDEDLTFGDFWEVCNVSDITKKYRCGICDAAFISIPELDQHHIDLLECQYVFHRPVRKEGGLSYLVDKQGWRVGSKGRRY